MPYCICTHYVARQCPDSIAFHVRTPHALLHNMYSLYVARQCPDSTAFHVRTPQALLHMYSLRT